MVAVGSHLRLKSAMLLHIYVEWLVLHQKLASVSDVVIFNNVLLALVRV